MPGPTMPFIKAYSAWVKVHVTGKGLFRRPIKVEPLPHPPLRPKAETR